LEKPSKRLAAITEEHLSLAKRTKKNFEIDLDEDHNINKNSTYLNSNNNNNDKGIKIDEERVPLLVLHSKGSEGESTISSDFQAAEILHAENHVSKINHSKDAQVFGEEFWTETVDQYIKKLFSEKRLRAVHEAGIIVNDFKHKADATRAYLLDCLLTERK
jgi:hypothetical protein